MSAEGRYRAGEGSVTVRLEHRLKQLQQAAREGDNGAANRAEALAVYLGKQGDAEAKRADDRVKVLVGAFVAGELAAGRRVALDDAGALLVALDRWLVRPAERDAVLGSDGTGSDAFRRVLGMTA